LACSLLAELARRDALPSEYSILETSAALAARQRERIAAELPQLAGRVRWLDRWPSDFCGAIVANEVLDAMPVARFVVADEGVREIGVDWRDGELVECELPARAELLAAVSQIEAEVGRLPQGYRSEVNLLLPAWLAGLSESLAAAAVLLIDYGYPRREYYAAERRRGTLQAHYRQRAFDAPLRWPGLCDLTAHVDFSATALAAQATGLAHEGFAPQAAFLLDCGIAGLAEQAMRDGDELARLRVAQQLRQLTLPGEMGEAFRVLGLSRGLAEPLPGFTHGDLSARL
jgi:SAM-dependent MidA family methyltransferase